MAKRAPKKPIEVPVDEEPVEEVTPFLSCGDCDKKWPVGTEHCTCGYKL